MTPARCNRKPLSCKTQGKSAVPLVDYVNIIVEKGKAHNIPVLNLYENLGIDPNNEEDREKYTADGLHFNEEGHMVLADFLIDFLKNL